MRAVNDEILESNCTVSCIQGGIVRFSLKGRGSLLMLDKVLQTVSPIISAESIAIAASSSTTVDKKFATITDGITNEEFFRKAMSYEPITRVWPEDAVLGIQVKDVRQLTAFGRGTERKADMKDIVSNGQSLQNIKINSTDELNSNVTETAVIKQSKLFWPREGSRSPIWHDDQRLNSSSAFIKDHVLNEKISNFRQLSSQSLRKKDEKENFTVDVRQPICPTLGQKHEHINTFPVLVIRKDLKNYSSERLYKSRKNTPFLGFDVVVPSGWGAVVWKAFQFAGARAIGTEELDSIQLDHGVASFPR
jgi:hypothetical protein